MTQPVEPLDLDAIRARYDETHAITGDAFGLIDKMRASCEDVPALLAEAERLRVLASGAGLLWYAVHSHVGTPHMHQHFPENVTPGHDHAGVPLVLYGRGGSGEL